MSTITNMTTEYTVSGRARGRRYRATRITRAIHIEAEGIKSVTVALRPLEALTPRRTKRLVEKWLSTGILRKVA